MEYLVERNKKKKERIKYKANADVLQFTIINRLLDYFFTQTLLYLVLH